MERSRPTAWLLGSVVVVPILVFDPGGFAPFGPLKFLAVSALAAGIAAALTWRGEVFVDRRWGWGWVAFLGWAVVVSVAAVDPLHTWIGTPDRHLGAFTWALFAVAFIGGISLRGDATALILRAAIVALLGIGGYVLVELAGIAPVELTSTADRAGGPFGSAAYLGAASSLLVPIAVGAAVDGFLGTGWRRAAVAAAGLGLVAALASQSRAAWVGLAAAALVSLPATRRWLVGRRPLVGGAAAAFVVVALVTPVGGRLVSALDFTDGGARGRLDEWRVGIAVMANHPVTGLGFEGYRIGFAESVDADYERRYGRVFTPDRAHNGALDVGVTTGAPGLLLYAAGAAGLVLAARRVVSAGPPWLVGVGAGVVGYLAQQQFLFPIAEVDPAFWAFAGVLVGATSTRVARRRIPSGMWFVPAALVVAALVAGGLDVAADRATRHALELEAAGSRLRASTAVETAVARRPDSIRYHFVAASISARRGGAAGLQRAVERLDDGLALSPEDPILLATRAGYQLDLAATSRSAALLAEATSSLEALVARDPFNAQLRLELGIAYALAGERALAETQWQTAADLAPTSTAPLVNLAALYLDAGRIQEAEETLSDIRALDPATPALIDLERRLAEIRSNGG